MNAKISLFGARDNLVSAINTAIADGKTTTSEKNNVNSKYDLFNDAIKSFNSAVEDANKAIQSKLDALSTDKVNNIKIGGVNLCPNTDISRDGIVSAWAGWKVTLQHSKGNYIRAIRNKTTSSTDFGIQSPLISGGLKKDREYTVSFEIGSMYHTDNFTYNYIMSSVGNKFINANLSINASTTDLQHKYFTFKADKDYPDARIMIGSITGNDANPSQGFTIRNFKIEEGNKVTPWGQAPEDYRKDIEKAQADANTANSLLADLSNDDILTPNEKQDVLKEWNIIKSERSTVIAQATNMNVNYSNYSVAYNDLSAYITPLLANMNVNSAITGSEFRAKFKAYYDAKIALLKDVTDKAKAIADAAKKAADDAAKAANDALSEAQALDYLKKALAGSTTIDGGLLLTSMIQLGIIDAGKFVEKAGINGTAKSNNDVIAWFGGTLQDAIKDLASIVFRADGSGKIGDWYIDGSSLLSPIQQLLGSTYQLKLNARGGSIDVLKSGNLFASVGFFATERSRFSSGVALYRDGDQYPSTYLTPTIFVMSETTNKHQPDSIRHVQITDSGIEIYNEATGKRKWITADN